VPVEAGGGLLEREDFLEALTHMQAATEQGRGRLVLLAAEAGGGKTALVQAFRAEMAGRASRVPATPCSRRALRAGHSLPDREIAALLERRAYECYLTGDIEEALAARRSALERYRRARERVHEGDQLRWISRLSWFIGRND